MIDASSRDGARKPHHPGWKPHTVQHLNGTDSLVQLDAQFQIVTEKWNRSIAVPYIAYMPEKDRILMLVTCRYPHPLAAPLARNSCTTSLGYSRIGRPMASRLKGRRQSSGDSTSIVVD